MTEEQPLSIGQYLRQERERKNISLESIAQKTRITLTNLQALERDDFQSFPAPLFIRGFIRSYASEIGTDPQSVLSMYETQTALPGDTKKTKSPARRSPKPLLVCIGILLILVAVGLLFFYSPEEKSPPVSSRPAAPLPVPVTPAPAPPAGEAGTGEDVKAQAPALAPPVVKPGTGENVKAQAPPPASPAVKPGKNVKVQGPLPAPPPAKAEKPPGKVSATTPVPSEGEKKERRHVLKIKAIEPTWVEIQADDNPPSDALLKSAETVTWTARRQFKITVGNAGGIEMSFNGVPQKSLGGPGQVAHLVLPGAKGSEEKEKEEP